MEKIKKKVIIKVKNRRGERINGEILGMCLTSGMDKWYNPLDRRG